MAANTPPDNSSYLLLEALKILLKQQKVTYPALARHLKLSVPSVKRAMNSPATSLQRIEQICAFLGVSLFDLWELARQESLVQFSFTEEQERFFAQNPHYLAYFFEVLEHHPSALEQKHGISRRSTLLYLKKLEHMGLLELHPGDVVKPKAKARGTIHWSDHGPLGRVFSRSMILNMASHAAERLEEPRELMVELSGWRLTPEEFKDLKREYRELHRRYQARSSFHKRTGNKSATLSVSAMALADVWNDPFQLRVKELSSVKL